MQNHLATLITKIQTLTMREEGQDLVEYGLVVALVAFGATAAMQVLGVALSSVFTAISSTLAVSV